MTISWEAITSISTVFLTLFTLGLMVATFWLAIIALQAKNAWKDEFKEKKKLDLLRKTKTLLNNLDIHLYTVSLETDRTLQGFEHVDKYLTILHNMLEELLLVQEELIDIKCEEFSNLFVSIAYKGNNSPFFKLLTNNPNTNVSASTEERQNQEVNALLTNANEIKDLINKSKIICDKEIQKFYTK